MSDTLADAKTYLQQNWKDGVSCPCCHQFVKQYRRKITGASAVFLIQLYHMSLGSFPAPWIKAKDVPAAKDHLARDYSKLRWWGLVEPHPANQRQGSPDRKSAGLWRITLRGRQFVEKTANVQAYSLSYNNTFLGFDGPYIGIEQCLGTKFDYKELMKG